MTVPSTRFREDYAGNGSATSFPYAFRIFKATDLVVTKTDSSGNDTTLTLGTDYTVTGAGSYNGGAVVLSTALPTSYRLTIERVLSIKQETDLRNQGEFLAETHEDAFDRLTMIVQRLAGYLGMGQGGTLRTLLLGTGDVDGAGAFRARGNRISGLGDPVDDADAAGKRWTQEQIASAVNVNGSSMLGVFAITIDTIVGASGLLWPDKATVIARGRDTVGDGAGGTLRFLKGSVAPANGITVYAVNGGRLVREGWSVFGVNVKWAGAKTGEGVDVAANTAAIQAAIDLSPFNLFFPEGTYLVNSLQYYWGDTGSQATRIWRGPGAIIKGAADSAPYLVDFSGQKLRVRDIEFQGKGEFDNDYECIWRFHTRNNTVNVNDLHFDGATARFNGKAVIYGLPTDTESLVSEVFFNSCTIKQVQRGVDVQGVGMVDSLWNNCYLTTSALPAPGNLDENYLFKINRGSHNLIGCEVVQTDLNAGQIPGWTALFPSTATKATFNLTGGILEVKSGFSWKDGADGGVAICNNTNGYWGYVHGDPLFKVGSGCTGGINLSNAKLLHDAANFQTDYGPLIVDSANSPEFRVYIDENTLIAPDDFQPLDLMTKIVGGKWNYPESQIVMVYGNDAVTVTAGNMSPVDFTTSWVDSAYTNNRLKGIYNNGVITIPQEGLQGAWIEVLVDWDQVTSKCYLVRRTSALCSVTNGSDYVQLVDQQNPGNFFPLTYQIGITPTAKVTGTGATAGMTVSAAFFDSTNFRLSSAWAGATNNVALTFEMKIGEIAKGELRRYDLGDFRPGDQFFLGLEAVSATTSTTLPYQRMRLVAKSRLNAMKVGGNN